MLAMPWPAAAPALSSGMAGVRHQFRIHVPAFVAGALLPVDNRELEHRLLRVLRADEGTELELWDGRGNVASARIASRKPLLLQVGEVARVEAARPHITLYQGLLRRADMGEALALAVEAGVDAFVPVITERSDRDVDGWMRDMSRWERIVVSAATQCGQDVLPALGAAVALRTAAAAVPAGTVAVAGVLGAAPLALPSPLPGAVAVFVGPEGGFSAVEVDMLAVAGVLPVAFSPLQQRSTHAGYALCSVIRYFGM